MFKRFSNAGVYSYCKHFYLQGQVYQHSTQLKSVIIYLRAFECRSVALAANQASVRSKATPKNSITRSGNCRSPQFVYFHVPCCGRRQAERQTSVHLVAAPWMDAPPPARSLSVSALCMSHRPLVCAARSILERVSKSNRPPLRGESVVHGELILRTGQEQRP